ncbi:MAG: T9SS type A sorting domain-containing protein [Bacteroidales bacterium]|nr:T9SS type A sorting domain-containing protein [Bacteroidales bacterium]
MKKHLLFFALALSMTTLMAQDTITGWTFPVNSGPDSLNADLGTDQNKGYDLRFQLIQTPTTDSTINSIVFTEGATTYAAATSGWQDGNAVRFWSVKFKAADYKNFKVSSKQKSSTDGPRDFKLQWRLSSSSYVDVTGGTIALGNDWTTGVINKLEVPITGQGTSSVYLRWLMNSNTDVSGGTVAQAGVSMIDDILVTAQSTLGVDEVVFTNRISLYPSPNRGSFSVQSTQPLSSINVLDASGKSVYTNEQPGLINKINLSGVSKGIYFLRVRFADNDKDYTQKFVIE